MENQTEIICVIDRSGSMHSIKDDAIGGFNTFIESQREVDGVANVTTILFDNEYDVIHDNVGIDKLELLNERTYVPRGTTALYDAIGKAISTVHGRISKNHEEPTKIICAILTDGEENSSQEYTHKAITALIKEMTEKHNWEFAYLGANADAFDTAQGLNIPVGNTMSFEATMDGMQTAYADMSRGVSKSRSMKSYSVGTMFTDDKDDKDDKNNQ